MDPCKFSKPATREYTYGPKAEINPDYDGKQGYDINWVLSEVSSIRNSLGADSVMRADLGITPDTAEAWSFPETLYTDFYGLKAGEKPPTSGKYPHAYTKAEYDGGAVPAIDASKDGKCTKRDSMAQW